MNIFLFHRDLRIQDNTTLIQQMKKCENITPIFIFTPEQILPKQNKYFSNNSVQFMIESLDDLKETIENEYKGKFYFFFGKTIDVLKSIHSQYPIHSIGFNIDYTPYAIKRDENIRTWCAKNEIICFHQEDLVLHPILTRETLKKDNTPYQIYTAYYNHCVENLRVAKPSTFKAFKFQSFPILKTNPHYIDKIHGFYKKNENIMVRGGRKEGLSILKKIAVFKNYEKNRNTLSQETTHLSAHNHFSTVSIREVYYSIINVIGKNTQLIKELYWRDFYMYITLHFPHVLQGQIGKTNHSFKPQYDCIHWSMNETHFHKWCNGQTGFVIVDAGQNQLNLTGYMHNRARMCSAMFLTKDLHISWKKGEKYFAKKLVDYSPMQNNGGWQWSSSTGVDSQPYFRIFNPWIQLKNFDKNCEYVKKWIPALKDVPNEDILKWYEPEIHNKWLKKGIQYYAPIVEHNMERIHAIKMYQNNIERKMKENTNGNNAIIQET